MFSHLRLKSELTQNVHFLADKFTKKELLVLCAAYELTVLKPKKIDDIRNLSQIKILQCDNMPNPNALLNVNVE